MAYPIQTHSFRLEACSDPNCGPHIVALDEDGNEICEIVLSRSTTVSFIKALQALLYDKAVNHEQD